MKNKRSVAAVAVADGLGVGFALGHHLFHTSVEELALLLQRADANGDRGQGDSGDDRGRDLSHAVDEHRLLFAAAVLLAVVRFAHRSGVTGATLWIRNLLARGGQDEITAHGT